MLKHYRQPFKFYLLSALIPWTLWSIAAFLSHQPGAERYKVWIGLLSLAGLSGPLLVAVAMICRDRLLKYDNARRLFAVPRGKRCYLVAALVLMPASILLAMGISLLFGYDRSQFAITGQATFSSAFFPVWFLLIVAPILEELAWHSYGTDSLRQRFSLFTTSMLFALYWGLWHMPLAMINGYYHSNLVVEGSLHAINFLVSIFPFVLLMNWLYYRSGRNILVTVALHMGANVFNEIFATHPDSKIIQTVLLLALSIVLLLVYRKEFFSNDRPNQVVRCLPDSGIIQPV